MLAELVAYFEREVDSQVASKTQDQPQIQKQWLTQVADSLEDAAKRLRACATKVK